MGGESLGFLGRDSSTTVDKLGHDSSDGFNTLGKRSDIQKKNFAGGITSFSGQNSSLDGSTVGDGFIGVDTLRRILSSEIFGNELLNLGNTSGSTDQHDFVDFTLAHIGIFHDTANRSHCLLKQIVVQFFESGPSQSLTEVVTFSEFFDFQTSLLLRRKGTLDTFDFLSKLLERTLVSGNIDIGLLLHHLDEVLHDTLIEIFSSQMGITVGGQNFKNSRVDGQQSDIECTSSKIENKDVGFTSGLVHTVGNCGSGRLVDDTFDLHSGNSTGILGCLTLGIVKVSRNGNNSVLDFLTQESFGGGLHLLKNHCGNFFWGVVGFLSGDCNLDHRLVLVGDNFIGDKFLVGLDGFVGKFTSNQTLDIKDGIFRVDGCLILGGISNETLGVIQEGNV
mmetsp:Transcript_4706/g.10345  ORF Transcript_4706/g.10345 Transcript_4706/m.10345 type:complete len:392 (+) Transcript_4706:682-1857(+)